MAEKRSTVSGLRHIPRILSFWSPGVSAEASPQTSAPCDYTFPLAWMAASPALRAHVEWAAGQDPQRRVLLSGIEYRRPGGDAFGRVDTVSAATAEGDCRLVLQPCNYAPSKLVAPRLHLSTWLRLAEGELPTCRLADSGLGHAVWWLQRCAAQDASFSVEIALHLRRQLKGQKKPKGNGTEATVVCEELFWAPAEMRSAPSPTAFCKVLAGLGSALRVLRCDGIRFSEEGFRSLPLLFPGVAAVAFAQCSVENARVSARHTATPADAHTDFLPWSGLPYQWSGLFYFTADHVGGEDFWRLTASHLLNAGPAVGPLAPPSLAPLRVFCISQSNISARRLSNVMTAVAQRQDAAALSSSSPPALEVELAFLKGNALNGGRWDWLVACAGASGDGLRAVMLPNTETDLDALSDALAEVASRCRGAKALPPSVAALKLFLLDVRWNIAVNDVFLQKLIDGGVHTEHMRIAGTDISAKVAAVMADRPSP